MTLYLDYETEPIGGGNPYYRCIHCKRSAPDINGRLEGHESYCSYRLSKVPFEDKSKQSSPKPSKYQFSDFSKK